MSVFAKVFQESLNNAPLKATPTKCHQNIYIGKVLSFHKWSKYWTIGKWFKLGWIVGSDVITEWTDLWQQRWSTLDTLSLSAASCAIMSQVMNHMNPFSGYFVSFCECLQTFGQLVETIWNVSFRSSQQSLSTYMHTNHGSDLVQTLREKLLAASITALLWWMMCAPEAVASKW